MHPKYFESLKQVQNISSVRVTTEEYLNRKGISLAEGYQRQCLREFRAQTDIQRKAQGFFSCW